jgi:hypothetical protein
MDDLFFESACLELVVLSPLLNLENDDINN